MSKDAELVSKDAVIASTKAELASKAAQMAALQAKGPSPSTKTDITNVLSSSGNRTLRRNAALIYGCVFWNVLLFISRCHFIKSSIGDEKRRCQSA